MHLLLVDDDDRLRSLLSQYLGDQGYAVSEAASSAEARALLSLLTADAMVLDVMMPGETGLELAASLPASLRPPILMLTALDAPADRIAGLEAGVEDYLTKPFQPRELLLRLANILKNRPTSAQTPEPFRFGDFTFDATKQRLLQGDTPIALTGAELVLLTELAATPGQTVSRERLAQALGSDETSRGVDVQIARLRKKIEADNTPPRHLLTIRGEGYKLMV
jgi:two-component system phosphate regulon response regulator OmpR